MGLFTHHAMPLKAATPQADAGLVLREPMLSDTEASARVVVVDEGRRSGGVGEALVTAVVEHGRPEIRIRRVAGADTYIPLGAAANLVLLQLDDVLSAARTLASSSWAPKGLVT